MVVPVLAIMDIRAVLDKKEEVNIALVSRKKLELRSGLWARKLMTV